MNDEVKNLFDDFEEALNDDKIYIAFELLKQLQFKAVDDKEIVKELEKRKEQTMNCQMLFTKIKVQVEGTFTLLTLTCPLSLVKKRHIMVSNADMRRDKNWTLVSKKR